MTKKLIAISFTILCSVTCNTAHALRVECTRVYHSATYRYWPAVYVFWTSREEDAYNRMDIRNSAKDTASGTANEDIAQYTIIPANELGGWVRDLLHNGAGVPPLPAVFMVRGKAKLYHNPPFGQVINGPEKTCVKPINTSPFHH